MGFFLDITLRNPYLLVKTSPSECYLPVVLISVALLKTSVHGLLVPILNAVPNPCTSALAQPSAAA